jgi:hypothetical protein
MNYWLVFVYMVIALLEVLRQRHAQLVMKLRY